MFKNSTIIALFATIAIICFSASVSAQQPAPEISTVKSDNNAGELNSSALDYLIVQQQQNANERIFVIARLDRGETAWALNLQRLQAARSYLVTMKDVNKEQVIFAEGKKTAGEGRLEFYLGSWLMLVSLAPHGKNVRLVCYTD